MPITACGRNKEKRRSGKGIKAAPKAMKKPRVKGGKGEARPPVQAPAVGAEMTPAAGGQHDDNCGRLY